MAATAYDLQIPSFEILVSEFLQMKEVGSSTPNSICVRLQNRVAPTETANVSKTQFEIAFTC